MSLSASAPVSHSTSWPAAITTAAMNRILAFLVPLFRLDDGCDNQAARAACIELPASYGPRTNKELRFAALTVAFSFGALDFLGKAAAPDLSVNQVLRLRGNANALHRAAHKSQEALDRLQDAEAEPANPAPPAQRFSPGQQTADKPVVGQPQAQPPLSASSPTEPTFNSDLPASADPADLVAFTRCAHASRQQRRAAERQAEKLRRRKQEEQRLAERAAARALSRQAA